MKEPRKIQYMYRYFGWQIDHRCRKCRHLYSFTSGDFEYRYCHAYFDSKPSTKNVGVWSENDFACGLFNKPLDGMPCVREKVEKPR